MASRSSSNAGRLSSPSSSQRLREGYATVSRGHPSSHDAVAGQQGRASSSAAALGTHIVPDPHALESLDDLIRQEQQQRERQQRSVTMPASSSANIPDSALLGDDGHDEDLTSSTATIRPLDARASPRQSHNSATPTGAGDSSFSQANGKPRDESRWNGWHLWRMESYTRRTTAQQQADEEARRAQRWKWPLQYVQSIRKRIASGSRSLQTANNAPEGNGHDEESSETRTDRHAAEDPIGMPTMPLRRMILVTLVVAGVQVAWCLEFGYGTPFLLSIGLSKSTTSLVWLAAPVSGLVVQPLIGVLSDISVSSCRRRQYILGSTLVVVLCAMVLAFSSAFASILTDILHAGLADWDPVRLQIRDDMNRFLAVTAFIFLDLSINGVQAASRALILDVTPSQLHSQVNAWAARMTHTGSILGYAAGWYDLSSAPWLRWIGGGQFRKYSLVSLIFVAVCAITTCLAIQEGGHDADFEVGSSNQTESNGDTVAATAAITRSSSAADRDHRLTFTQRASEAFSHIWQSIRRLPRAVRRICLVQLFAHMGWFPFLVYATQWIIETRQSSTPAKDRQDTTAPGDEDTEIGSFALLMFALVSLAAGIILPFVALSHRPERSIRLEGPEHERASMNGHRSKNIFGRRTWRLTLRTIWTLSLILYGAIATIGTFFVKNVQDATILVAIVGIPWAVAVWVPYALVMESVREAEDGNSPFEFEADWFAPERVRNRRRSSMNGRQSSSHGSRARARAERALRDCGPLVARPGVNGEQPRMPGSILARGGEIVGGSASDSRVASGLNSPASRATFGEAGSSEPMRYGRHPYDTSDAVDEDSVGGTVLGIHNMSVVIPQLVTAVFAAAILRSKPSLLLIGTLQANEAAYAPSIVANTAESGGMGVVWIIRLGGVASFIAALLTRFVPLTRTERMVLASLKGKSITIKNGSALSSASAPRFDDEASDGDEEDEDRAEQRNGQGA